ncbi:hypothetical protein NDU88_002807 [Pleurodeles waltl]|uniref:Uncharacterized protein n=1 Tax=Pleurodeles waltl TaxID=8319 RepID=A0AAV7PA64_PLEWA|nr:hypothetical protein NDU88_002807 [Pleurodeles waltl]
MFGVPRANHAERNPEQRKTAMCEHPRCSCDAKEKLIGTRSARSRNGSSLLRLTALTAVAVFRMFGVPRANHAERNPEQRKTAVCEHPRSACDAKEKLIGRRSGNRCY